MNTNTNQTTTHHGGLDGAVLGGVLGHEHGQGHTGRDAVLGGLAGHSAEKHHEHHGAAKLNPDGTVKPSIGDKIAGNVDVLVGKVTNNPAKVQEGEIKKGNVI